MRDVLVIIPLSSDRVLAFPKDFQNYLSMKITTLILFVFLGYFNLMGQPEKVGDNKLETENKVYQETEKDYQRFIKKQARLRKKLDKYIEPQDLDKLEVLRSAYYNFIEEGKKKTAYISKIRPENSAMFVEMWTRMNDRFSHQIRAHEILNPMLLANKKYYADAEYLVEKYDTQIAPVRKKIVKAYLKLKMKWYKAGLKYQEGKRNLKEEKKQEKEIKKSNKEFINSMDTLNKTTSQPKVFTYTKVLITRSEI